MLIKRDFMALSTALLVSTLTACGGGSESVTEEIPTVSPPPTEALQSYSGTTADGYLVNANVCLDVNGSGQCDEDEPSTLTTAGGVFDFTEISNDIDLSTTAIIVEVIAGQTEDEDEPGVAITEGYTLTAPAGSSNFISPLSTMLTAELNADGTLTLNEAKSIIEERLGLIDPEIDILSDYVAGESVEGEASAEYKRLHHVARVVAKIVAKTLKQVLDNGGTGGDAESKEVKQAIRKTLSENIDLITALIDDAQNNEVTLDLETIIEILTEDLPLEVADIQAKVEQHREQHQKEAAIVRELLEQEGGFFQLDGEEERFFREDIEQCVVERGASYQQIRSIEGIIEENAYYFHQEENAFVMEEADAETNLVWNGETWQPASESIEILSDNEDGSITISTPDEGNQQVWAEAKSITGKKVKHFINDVTAWQNILSPELLFPENAMAYKIKSKRITDVSVMPFSDGCLDADYSGSCNLIFVNSDLPATSYDDILTPETAERTAMNDDDDGTVTPSGDKMVLLNEHQGYKVLVSLLGAVDDDSGSVNYFLDKSEVCEKDYCQELHFIGTGKWQKGNLGITLNYPSNVHAWLDERRTKPAFTIHDGYLRRSYTLAAGSTSNGQWYFNATAMESMVENFNADKLREELEPKYCGIKDDDDQEPDEPSKPEITSDPEATNKISNSFYFIEDDMFSALLAFDAEDKLRIWHEEREEEMSTDFQTGHWTINSEHKILLDFSDEDWSLLKVIEDTLGKDVMWTKEYEDDYWREYKMLKTTPALAEQFIDSLNFNLTSQADPDCSIDFDLEMTAESMTQGTGLANMEKCDHRVQNQQFISELSWWVGEDGELIFQWLGNTSSDDDTSLSDYQHHLYWVHAENKQRILFRSAFKNDNNGDDSELFESFNYQTIAF